jgi:hypothetical protein
MNQPPEELPGDSKPKWLTRKIYETDSEKKKDFWIGVGLFFGLNILLGICSWGSTVFFSIGHILQSSL